MAYEAISDGALDYSLCSYGLSKNVFRGPLRNYAPPYVAVLGGTITYGKFIETPFPALLERELNRQVVNLGVVNASADLYLNDPVLIDIANSAQMTVIQVTGAHNLNNRYYSVHPRRNDRFVKASALMRSVFKDMDFADVHFTRHLLDSLRKRSPERFGLVVDELRHSWVTHMGRLLQSIHSPIMLVYVSETPPPDDNAPLIGLGREPLFVTKSMLRVMKSHITQYVEVIPSATLLENPDGAGMVFSDLEGPAAMRVMPPTVHQLISKTLAPRLEPYLSD